MFSLRKHIFHVGEFYSSSSLIFDEKPLSVPRVGQASHIFTKNPFFSVITIKHVVLKIP